MKLRSRLAIGMALTMAASLTVVYRVTEYLREQQADRALAFAIDTAMAGDGRSRCEARPATFGGGDLTPLPPLVGPVSGGQQLFAYDAAFHSANATAPPLSDDLRAALSSGHQRAGGTYPVSSGYGRQLARQMPWADGPCTIALSRFGAYTISASTQLFRATLVVLVFVPTMLVTAIPLITRIRRLTAAVQTSAESMYTIPIPETGQDELGELERAFNRASEQVKSQMTTIREREATLRSVVSNTTHDVAVPLTVIHGYLSAAIPLLPSDSPAHDGLRAAIRETHYLGALLHNLETAARLDHPVAAMEPCTVNLNELIERVVGRHAPLAQTLGVELGSGVPEDPVLVMGDATLIEQAASNLVHNAIHYNQPGGHVAVVLSTTRAGARFSLRVTDDGPGIPPDERARLTDRTFRGAIGRTRRPEGQGLGLHIVREVAERHGFGLRLDASECGGVDVELDGACGALTAPSTPSAS